jgi:hypothetical protein
VRPKVVTSQTYDLTKSISIEKPVTLFTKTTHKIINAINK